MKTLSELINLDESGLVLIREWAAEAKNPVEVLTCDRPDGERALLALQVTTRSPMGALAYETGGLLVDHGWVRVLGAGCPRLPRGIDTWNGLAGGTRKIEGALLVADDAVGGFFALNGDGLPGPAGHVFYHAPDRLAWEDTAKGYSDWLNWLFLGDLVRQIPRPLQVDFIVASSYGDSTVSSGNVRLVYDPETRLEGKHILLVEDIIDTGRTLNRLVELLRSRNPRSLEICALLDKHLADDLKVQPKFLGFDAPKEFLVGYGLDHAEDFRHLPFVASLAD